MSNVPTPELPFHSLTMRQRLDLHVIVVHVQIQLISVLSSCPALLVDVVFGPAEREISDPKTNHNSATAGARN